MVAAMSSIYHPCDAGASVAIKATLRGICMFNPLTTQEIDALIMSKKTGKVKRGVKEIAVRNFLGSLGQADDMDGEMANMYMDASLYQWSPETIGVIQRGISKAYSRGK